MRNTSNMNIFFNLTFEDIFYVKNLNSKITHTTNNSIITNNLTLKKFRKYNLDSLWRKYLRFE